MTDYADFIHDFPSRCAEILGRFYNEAKVENREVTLLIMAAAAAFLIPFERLRPGMSTKHPACDRERFPERAKRLDSALGQPFLGSPFHNDDDGSWSIGWKDRPKIVELAPLPKETQAAQVLAIIRNALAHGNLWTIPSSHSEIEALIFWAEDRKKEQITGYKYVRVSPRAFYNFLNSWCTFLKRERLSPRIVFETLDRAA